MPPAETTRPQGATTDAPRPAPIPIADELCEILVRRDHRRATPRLTALVRAAAGVVDEVLAEVERRGLLERLLPDRPSEENAVLLDALVSGVARREGVFFLGRALVRRRKDYDRVGLDLLILRAIELGVLSEVFADLVAQRFYKQMVALLTSDGTSDSTQLRALAAARPGYEHEALNAPAIERLHGGGVARAAYDVIIVPGFTPLETKAPRRVAELPAARGRLERAIAVLTAGLAPRLLVTGGAVHPPGTPVVEALDMRAYLLERGVPADRILVEPYARHSTTNLRNAGRMMRELGLAEALVVTGGELPVFDQAFYFGYPTLSTFLSRSIGTLGYPVGELRPAGDKQVAFRPAPEVSRPNWRDPLDW